MTGDLQEAEDVVQEAFARASVRWGRLRDYDVPERWVRRVALNLAANGGRQRRAQLAALLRLGPAPSVPAVSVEALAVVEAVAALPVAHRQVVACSITCSACRSRRRRASSASRSGRSRAGWPGRGAPSRPCWKSTPRKGRG